MNDFPVIGDPCFGHRILGSPGDKHGSFENEALENEDRKTKHPKLENEDP